MMSTREWHDHTAPYGYLFIMTTAEGSGTIDENQIRDPYQQLGYIMLHLGLGRGQSMAVGLHIEFPPQSHGRVLRHGIFVGTSFARTSSCSRFANSALAPLRHIPLVLSTRVQGG